MSLIKPKLLFHVCCAPCSGLISRKLAAEFDIAIYFDNPNIWPEEEYSKRWTEAENFFRGEGLEIVNTGWQHQAWLESVKGLESEPEMGRRCLVCYYNRLKNTAKFAAANGYGYFTTSLSISPYKDQAALVSLGRALAKDYGIKFHDQDFRAENGYQQATEFAKEKQFYRQKYCGCEYSKKIV